MTFSAAELRLLAAGDRAVATAMRSPRNAEFARRWRERMGKDEVRRRNREAWRRFVASKTADEAAELRRRRLEAVHRYRDRVRDDAEYRRRNAERCRRWHAAKKARAATSPALTP